MVLRAGSESGRFLVKLDDAIASLQTRAAHESGGIERAFIAEAKKNNALQQPVNPSPELAAVIGAGSVTRAEMVKKAWDYIKAHNLQNPANKREILADAKLKPIFGADRVTMFQMSSLLSKYVTK
jgi:hypothetical protein